jgi:hypothetical protein
MTSNNASLLKHYTKTKQSLKVKQVDNNGKVVNIFNNRYQAAIWILENNLTNYFHKSVGATRACIAGSLTNSMKNGKTAYGYVWEFLPITNKQKPTISYDRLPTGIAKGNPKGRVIKIISDNKEIELPSISSAAILLSATKAKLRYAFSKSNTAQIGDTTIIKKRKSPTKEGIYMKHLQEINSNICVAAKNIVTNEMIKFSSMTKAAKVFGIDRKTIKRSIMKIKPHKNIQWKLVIKN